MLQKSEMRVAFLGATDPDPVEVVNPAGGSPVLLVCEHAGRAIPASLRDLSIAATEMERHIAWDIGAAGLARKLSTTLDATLVMQRYSRLVIDCNRPLEALDCIPEWSDGTAIPLNCDLAHLDRMRRFDEIHRPFHDCISGLLDRRQADSAPTVLATIHSFTPRFADQARPWQLGVCFNRDSSFAEKFINAFTAANPEIVAAYNEPYTVDDLSDYTIPVHGERRGLPHVLLEVRNDEIRDEDGQVRWARMIGEALNAASHSPLMESRHGG